MEKHIIEQISERSRVGSSDPPSNVPYYISAQRVAEMLGLRNTKNIPADMPRFYPGGRKRKPIFRSDQVIAYIENNQKNEPKEPKQ